MEKKLKMFCQTTFSETFVNWMHLKVIRCFVEAVLRYGLPVDFSISCVKVKFDICVVILDGILIINCIVLFFLQQPTKGNEKRFLKQMDLKYQHLVDQKFQQQSDTTEMDYSGLGGEFHPYVCIPLKIEL